MRQALGLKAGPLDVSDWRDLVDRVESIRRRRFRIAVVGKYMKHRDAYKSVYRSRSTTPASRIGRGDRADESRRRKSAAKGRSRSCPGSTASSCQAALACAGSRGKSRRFATPGRETSRFSASAWGCSAHRSSSLAASSAWKTRTARSSIRQTLHAVISLMEDQTKVREAQSDTIGPRRMALPACPAERTLQSLLGPG